MNINQIPQYGLIKEAFNFATYYKSTQEKQKESQENKIHTSLFNSILSLEVSEDSFFSDTKWQLITCELAPSTSKSNYSINWDLYSNLPDVLLFKFKLLAHISIIDKRALCVFKRTKELSVLTIVAKLKKILKFFNDCFSYLESEHGTEYTSTISSLSEIDKDILIYTAKNNDLASPTSMREALKSIDKIENLQLMNEDPHKVARFSKLPFKELTEEQKKPFNNIDYIPHEIFQIIDSDSSLSIANFLYSVGSQPSCKSTDNAYKLAISDGSCIKTKYSYNILESVIANFYRQSESLQNQPELYKKTCLSYKCNSILSRDELVHLGIDYKLARKYLIDLQSKAIFIIGAYTGLRPRELINLDLVSRNAITEENGIMEIYASIIKGRNRTELFTDKFVVIPIVYDAIQAIKIIKKIYRSDIKQVEQLKDGVLTQHSVESIKSRIQLVFDDSIGKGVIDFYPYLLRHNLAYQLYRVELGLPFISYALKHVVSGIDKFKSVSKVTLGYGSIGDKLAGKSTTARSLQKEVAIERVKSQFNPNGNYSGGGAKIHRSKLETIFQGYMASGYSKEEIYMQMVEQGYYLMNVGKLYCMANEATEKFDDTLPCIGGLRCNPIDCPNALISKEHTAVWRELHADNISIQNELIPQCCGDDIRLRQITSAIETSTKVLNSFMDKKL